jgi:uncharacterized lipoprotein YmbA
MLAGVLMLTACGKTAPAKFYSLQPATQTPLGNTLPRDVALAIGPVAIPGAMERNEIVVYDSGNAVSFSDFHRWAGPLDQSIASVVAQNIGTLLDTERVTPFTRENIFQPSHRVVISINRYESRLSDSFLLDATWSIKDLKEQKVLSLQNSKIQETLSSAGYEELVAAQSRALGAISEEIAAELVKVVP